MLKTIQNPTPSQSYPQSPVLQANTLPYLCYTQSLLTCALLTLLPILSTLTLINKSQSISAWLKPKKGSYLTIWLRNPHGNISSHSAADILGYLYVVPNPHQVVSNSRTSVMIIPLSGCLSFTYMKVLLPFTSFKLHTIKFFFQQNLP